MQGGVWPPIVRCLYVRPPATLVVSMRADGHIDNLSPMCHKRFLLFVCRAVVLCSCVSPRPAACLKNEMLHRSDSSHSSDYCCGVIVCGSNAILVLQKSLPARVVYLLWSFHLEFSSKTKNINISALLVVGGAAPVCMWGEEKPEGPPSPLGFSVAWFCEVSGYLNCPIALQCWQCFRPTGSPFSTAVFLSVQSTYARPDFVGYLRDKASRKLLQT